MIDVVNKTGYEENFLKSINKLTGIPINKIKKYSKENNLFNILERPSVLDLNDKQLKKIDKLNQFLEAYNILKIKEGENRIKFTCPLDAGMYFKALLSRKKDCERFMVAFLDNSNSIIEKKIISEGDVGSTIVYPRKILKLALANDCSGIVLAHNHPGGSLEPSKEDKLLTQKIVNIFEPLNIRVLDHIIVGGASYSSMADKGYLTNSVSGIASYTPVALDKNEDEEDYELE